MKTLTSQYVIYFLLHNTIPVQGIGFLLCSKKAYSIYIILRFYIRFIEITVSILIMYQIDIYLDLRLSHHSLLTTYITDPKLT